MQGFDGSGRDAATVMKTFIALGCELNMRGIVEGVETAKQAARRNKVDGDQAQGSVDRFLPLGSRLAFSRDPKRTKLRLP
jgi:EAL domain-containing protein (putative c-di-GMP-specific phosphodiesterase class I)